MTPPPAAPPEPYRFGQNAPAWAAGKTPEELLGIAQQMATALERQQPAPQPAAPAAPQSFDIGVGDDDYLTGAQVKRVLQQFQGQQRGPDPYSQQAIQMAAENAIGQARFQFKRDFDRFGPEILAKLSMLPPDQKTLPNIEMVVKMVRGEHLEELAGERARELLGQMEPSTRALGGAGMAPSSHPTTNVGILDDPRIPEDARKRMRDSGLNETTIARFMETQGLSRDQFIARYAGHTVGGGR